MSKFEVELKTYEQKLPELLAQEGKFIVIKGDAIIGMYDTYSDALQAGYAKVGLEEFFVRQIAALPQMSYFSRDLVACPQ